MRAHRVAKNDDPKSRLEQPRAALPRGVTQRRRRNVQSLGNHSAGDFESMGREAAISDRSWAEGPRVPETASRAPELAGDARGYATVVRARRITHVAPPVIRSAATSGSAGVIGSWTRRFGLKAPSSSVNLSTTGNARDAETSPADSR